MKISTRCLVVAIVLCVMLSMTELFYAFYYSWLVTVPGLTPEGKAYYDQIAKLLGIPSLLLLGIAIALTVWGYLRKK